MNRREYFIQARLAEGLDLHAAGEAWFAHEHRSKALRRVKRIADRRSKQVSEDMRRSRKAFPSHYDKTGARTIRGVRA